MPLILGGGRRVQNGSVDDGAPRQDPALFCQMVIELGKEGIAQDMSIQQIAEAQNGTLVRHPQQLHPRKKRWPDIQPAWQ